MCDHGCVRKLYPTLSLPVKNLGDKAVVVTTSEHFAEVDADLSFDRQRAYGCVWR